MECVACAGEMVRLKEELHACKSCGLISSEDKADSTLYDIGYNKKYLEYERTDIGRGLDDLRVGLIREHIEDPRDAILDFGCGSGSFVRSLRASGFQNSFGFDINQHSPHNDISVLLKETYSAVTFWDSLEHINDPSLIIEGLSPDYVFVSVPSTDAIEGGIANIKSWRHYRPHEHIHYFDEHSLEEMLFYCGYNIVGGNYNESNLRRGGGDKNILTMVGRRMHAFR